jgi:colanic acid/amylovoran biosynthesis glycosyltransferase
MKNAEAGIPANQFPPGLAYIFERFPSFTQTFCAREVAAMRRHGFEGPVFSIRTVKEEPVCQKFEDVGETIDLPESYDEILSNDRRFRHDARKWQARLCEAWGSEQEKRRIYESLWLLRNCQSHGIRHVHTHFAALAARTAFWLHQMGGPTYSVTAHANDIFRDEPPERLAAVLGSAARVVTVSDFSAAFLAEHFPDLKPKIRRVYNGIDPSRFPQSKFPGGIPKIVAVGRSIEKKGFDVLIDACGLLGGRDFECVIVGGGPLDEMLCGRVEALGLQGRVTIAGPRTEAEIAALLSQARMFVLPCIKGSDGALDNLPTVIMEAMAAGLPVISTPLAGIPEMVEDGRSGILVPECDAHKLAHAMSRLLDSPDLAQQAGAEGRKLCLERFAISHTSVDLMNVWKEVLSTTCQI